MKKRESLSGQVVAANLLLVVAALFAASAASSLLSRGDSLIARTSSPAAHDRVQRRQHRLHARGVAGLHHARKGGTVAAARAVERPPSAADATSSAPDLS